MKLKYLGFIIGIILLLTGWVIRGVAFFLVAETAKSYVLNKVGIIISKMSVFFLCGGILFYTFILSKEEQPKQIETLTEEQEKEKIKQELEDISYEIKSDIGFTIVYVIMSILLTGLSLCTIFINKVVNLWSVNSLLLGIFLNQYYIRNLVCKLRWLSRYEKNKKKL